jgi:hypothetical protein
MTGLRAETGRFAEEAGMILSAAATPAQACERRAEALHLQDRITNLPPSRNRGASPYGKARPEA